MAESLVHKNVSNVNPRGFLSPSLLMTLRLIVVSAVVCYVFVTSALFVPSSMAETFVSGLPYYIIALAVLSIIIVCCRWPWREAIVSMFIRLPAIAALVPVILLCSLLFDMLLLGALGIFGIYIDVPFFYWDHANDTIPLYQNRGSG